MKSLYPVKSDYFKDTDAIGPSDAIYSGMLVANVEQTVTVPTGADFALFLPDLSIYVNYDTTAAIPTGTISQAGGEPNPDIRYVGDTTTLHLIAPASTKVSIAFYGK